MYGNGASGAQPLLRLGADLLAAHVLFLVILRLAAGHILLLLLLGRGWFAGERHRRTDAKREERCECDEACVASHGILLVMNELMKPSHCNMRCCDSRKHFVRLTSGEALCLRSRAKLMPHNSEWGQIEQGHSQNSGKISRSQRLMENLHGTTEGGVMRGTVNFCRREPAESSGQQSLLSL